MMQQNLHTTCPVHTDRGDKTDKNKLAYFILKTKYLRRVWKILRFSAYSIFLVSMPLQYSQSIAP